MRWRMMGFMSGLLACGIAQAADPGAPAEQGINTTAIYAFTMKTIDGREQLLAVYRGKALLVVNTASRCGFTPQYRSLEALYERYRERGFEILAFPANNFRSQEPGTDPEIKQFCELTYHVTFPLFSKISVKGDDLHPLYRYLTTAAGFNGPITWNFNKFLISPEGWVVARYDSQIDPLDPMLVSQLEAVLPRR